MARKYQDVVNENKTLQKQKEELNAVISDVKRKNLELEREKRKLQLECAKLRKALECRSHGLTEDYILDLVKLAMSFNALKEA